MVASPQRRSALLALAFLASTSGTAMAQSQDVPPLAPGELDPESPMAPLPEIGVEWPDLDKDLPPLPDEPMEPALPNAPITGQVPPPAEAVKTSDIEGERRYKVMLEGIEITDKDLFIQRFNQLSVLKDGEGKASNVAQIDRRAREDTDLLNELFRAEGYYDAVVETQVDAVGDQLVVKLVSAPGPLYRFAKVDVRGLESTGDKAPELRAAFGVDEQDPVDADDVVAGKIELTTQIKSVGYPFAKVGEPDVLVDHDTRLADLTMDVEPGGIRNFGQILLTGTKLPFDAKHVSRIARFKTGELYNQGEVDDLRRALIATGLSSQVKVTPVPAADPMLADISVELEPAPLRTIAGEAGYGTGEGIRVEASWTHRNLIRPEGAVTFRGVAGTREQYLGATLRQSNFRKRDQVLNARIAASNVDRDAYEARTFEIAGNIERQTNIIWQKKWTWSAGFELLASSERDQTKIVNAPRRTYFIAAVPGSLNYDGSDDLLDATKGFRLGGRISPEVSQQQSNTETYVRAQIDASYYQPAGEKIVVAGRVRLGSIVGAGVSAIAPSRRFYSGGGGSVRGYGYQQIGPRDIDNTPIGGRGLAEFALEARVRFGTAFGVVPFIDGGSISPSALPTLNNFRLGAGIGGRYYSSFGPIRIDVGTPLNPRKGDSRVTVYVSLGQAF